MLDKSNYLVLYPDETRGFGSGASSPIPTIGAAASVIDQYRTIAVRSTNLPALGAAFTDVSAVAAISRVAEGGITDIAELEAAETALQALLLHEIVHVLVPCPKRWLRCAKGWTQEYLADRAGLNVSTTPGSLEKNSIKSHLFDGN